jgi:hypothetical protein
MVVDEEVGAETSCNGEAFGTETCSKDGSHGLDSCLDMQVDPGEDWTNTSTALPVLRSENRPCWKPTAKDRDNLGGVEYKSLKLLLKVVSGTCSTLSTLSHQHCSRHQLITLVFTSSEPLAWWAGS